MKPTQGFRLDALGYFQDAAGRRVVPVGVNYWPASCGVEMWQAWPADEIRRDLDLVRELGFNTVRFFLRWQDFEPNRGAHDARNLSRLDQLLSWHRERGLLAHPSLFVGWMSGGIFWPPWFEGRNVFSDPELLGRAGALAAAASAVCSHYPETILAMDQGNELCCLPENQTASPALVSRWCAEVSGAIKGAFPDALVVSGNEQTQVVADSGWRFGAQPGCDFYSMHSYPVSAWHALAFDGMADPLAQSLLPFYIKCARAWGPVMAQEFGTLLTRGEGECDGYLRAILPACWRAGANGFLWWCLRDIAARGHPYDKNAFEGLLGLVDANDQVKPGLRYFQAFAREIAQAAPPRATSTGALYWPSEYYPRDNPLNPGNEPRHLSRQLAVAHFALGQLGHDWPMVRRGDLANLATSSVLVIAGAKLTSPEVASVAEWVRAGGRVIWHGPDAMTWGAEMEALLGAEPLDFRAPRATGVNAFGATWSFDRFPRDIFLKVRLRSAVPWASDDEARPVIFTHAFGQGRVAVCLAEADAQFAAHSDQPSAREMWLRWYRGMFALLLVFAVSFCGR